jgi:hypothetical protein
MDLTQTLKKFLNKSPAVSQQHKYKQRAKQQGLLSILELSEVLSSDDETLKTEFFEELQATKKLSIPVEFTLTAQDLQLASSSNKGQIKKSTKIYHNGNFHGIDLSKDDLQYAVDNFQQEVVNVNHSSYPEDAFGFFTNLSIGSDNQSLSADLELFTDHPAFTKQKYAMTQGAELGWSIEVTFGDVLLSFKDWSFQFKEPMITGLASTMIPSAPKTLMQDEQLEDNKPNQTDLNGPPQHNINTTNMEEEALDPKVQVQEKLEDSGSTQDTPITDNTQLASINNQLEMVTNKLTELQAIATKNQELETTLNQQTELLQAFADTITKMSEKIANLEAKTTQLKTVNIIS